MRLINTSSTKQKRMKSDCERWGMCVVAKGEGLKENKFISFIFVQ